MNLKLCRIFCLFMLLFANNTIANITNYEVVLSIAETTHVPTEQDPYLGEIYAGLSATTAFSFNEVTGKIGPFISNNIDYSTFDVINSSVQIVGTGGIYYGPYYTEETYPFPKDQFVNGNTIVLPSSGWRFEEGNPPSGSSPEITFSFSINKNSIVLTGATLLGGTPIIGGNWNQLYMYVIPSPEPSEYVLFLIGLPLISWVVHRKYPNGRHYI